MTKKQAFLYVLTAIVFSLLANVFVGRYISAKISTWPLLNRFHIVGPQAPIVINNQQVVHTSESTDFIQAANSAKSRLATVAEIDSTGTVSSVGSAVNIASDGVFVTGLPTFAAQNVKYVVVLNDGSNAPISTTTIDTATGLVFFRASVSGISPADFGKSADLLPGEKVLFLNNGLQNFSSRFSASYVMRTEGDIAGLIFDSDKPSRGFSAQVAQNMISGQAIANLDGQIVGIWNGTNIIPSDVLQQEVGNYFANKLTRPQFNFIYSIITKTESIISGMPQGALVKTATFKGVQQLENGDIITSVDGANVSETSTLETILQKYKTGDSVKFSVMRNKQQISITEKAQ